MHSELILTCLLIILGRIVDVTLGTVRTIFVVQGRRGWACVLGFFEVVIWIFVVARVINGISENPYYAASYGIGFAAGNFFGITVENWLAFGDQVLLLFSRNGGQIAAHLREHGLRITEFEGNGRDGPMRMLMLVLARQESPHVIERALQIDSSCFYVLNDIREAPAITARFYVPTGWRAVRKMK